MAFYLKRIAKRDTQADIAERIAYRQVCERANAETFVKYPQITAENFEEACRFKDERISALLAQPTTQELDQ